MTNFEGRVDLTNFSILINEIVDLIKRIFSSSYIIYFEGLYNEMGRIQMQFHGKLIIFKG